MGSRDSKQWREDITCCNSASEASLLLKFYQESGYEVWVMLLPLDPVCDFTASQELYIYIIFDCIDLINYVVRISFHQECNYYNIIITILDYVVSISFHKECKNLKFILPSECSTVWCHGTTYPWSLHGVLPHTSGDKFIPMARPTTAVLVQAISQPVAFPCSFVLLPSQPLLKTSLKLKWCHSTPCHSGQPQTYLRGSPVPLDTFGASRPAAILDKVTTRNDINSWDCLFRFPSRCLRDPKREGHRQSLASEVNQQLREETEPIPSQPPSHNHTKRRGD